MPQTPSRGLQAAAALLLAAALALAAPALAWTPATRQVIAEEAARLAPPDLARQIDRHLAELRAGAALPCPLARGNGAGLEHRAATEAERAVAAIRDHRPFAEVVRQLGVVTACVAATNHPLEAASSDPREASYAADYERYVESALPRFRLLFYGIEPTFDRGGDVAALLARSLARGGDLYPLIGQEYRRIGFASGVRSFDDRSTAFGVSSLAFNYAVNDVILVLRHVWLRGGGADPRGGLPRVGQRLLLLPRVTAPGH